MQNLTKFRQYSHIAAHHIAGEISIDIYRSARKNYPRNLEVILLKPQKVNLRHMLHTCYPQLSNSPYRVWSLMTVYHFVTFQLYNCFHKISKESFDSFFQKHFIQEKKPANFYEFCKVTDFFYSSDFFFHLKSK